MTLQRHVFTFLLAVGLTAGSFAVGAEEQPLSKRWYRYYNDKGVPTLSDQITEEHIRRGYEIVDRNMQVIKRMSPFDEKLYEKDKVKREAAMRQQQEDARILRLYSTSHDAELARNRQLDTLETSIGYNSLQLIRLKRLRADAVEQAAEAERSGQAPSQKLKQQVAQYDKQITDLQQLINSQRSEQEKVRNDFIPIVKRLTELESGTTGETAAAAAAAAARAPR